MATLNSSTIYDDSTTKVLASEPSPKLLPILISGQAWPKGN